MDGHDLVGSNGDSDPDATIDATAFPLFVELGPSMMLLQPVPRDAVSGLDEAYTEASLDGTTGIQSTGTTIDAHWRVAPDHAQVLLVLKGRQPSTFDLSVRFGAQEPEEKEFFLGLAHHEETKGPVSLSIYPDKEGVVRAAAALQAGDADLFSSLGAGVESAMPCRTLKRLARQPR
ncbi:MULTISPECIES: hypothetical protein [unclassified Streptomyces]|uniref:hypothetical protein n=1 Tax=unclassified Streptomyces TaxID=2593676 RepID=UPI00224C837A|nr:MULTISPECIES: hypothetical protein [unclassified Streptomyces]MCX5443792.1 hypothetical protein [Streptomyces sp. NBC_00063]WUB90870.1 hypothetical protein OHO83_00145 [Streptomyces sp. NBC_00569]WUB99169.1 hypothetical protein OHO83_46745 [Streptomyces sp. NBC_00569]